VTPSILLTGGTGTLGRRVAPLLRQAGCTVRVLSRRGHEPAEGLEVVTGDLATGEGLDAAVGGVETIVHCAGSAQDDDDKTRNLVAAASRVGTPHLVYISVVGADRIPVVSGIDRAMFGYFAAKHAAERIVADSGLPWTTLRATQFHDFVATWAQGFARSPVVPAMAGVRLQPVDAGDVATRLAELALSRPAGLVPDIAGPHIHPMTELLRGYLRSRGRRQLVLPVRQVGRAARAFRAGANLAPDRAIDGRTWEDFLAAATPAPAAG
jgi:uncharacterized protein YbjT (DUF2867 family)